MRYKLQRRMKSDMTIFPRIGNTIYTSVSKTLLTSPFKIKMKEKIDTKVNKTI